MGQRLKAVGVRCRRFSYLAEDPQPASLGAAAQVGYSTAGSVARAAWPLLGVQQDLRPNQRL